MAGSSTDNGSSSLAVTRIPATPTTSAAPATSPPTGEGPGEPLDGVPDQPVFYFDLGSPESYLVAERILAELPVVAEWQPVLAGRLRYGEPAFRCAEERGIYEDELARRGRALGLQPVRFREGWPPDTDLVMRSATFAKQMGRTVAFALAAFRQAFAAARDLTDPETVLIAGAACEMHPNALLKGVELRSVRRRLDTATTTAAGRGVQTVPTIRVGDALFAGPRALEDAGGLLREA